MPGTGRSYFQCQCPVHVVNGFGTNGVITPFGPEHHDTADHQRGGYGDGVEQVFVDQVGKSDTEDNCRHEGDQQVQGELLCLRLLGQANHYVQDLAPILPDHRENCPELNDDVEGQRPLATKTDQVSNNDLVTGTGYRQKLGYTLDHAQNQRLNRNPKIHLFP